jgi:hypothetical protein
LIPHFVQHEFGAVAVLDVPGMHRHGKHQPQHVNDQMPFRSVDFFPAS